MTDDLFSPLRDGAPRERIRELEADAAGAARRIADAFDGAGAAIAESFAAAAESGRISFQSMARDIASAFADLAVDRLVEGPVAGLLESVLASIPFFGARAEGGPVSSGGAYLVGETGPEVFRPDSAGEVTPVGGAPVVVNIHLQSGADAAVLRRSEGQISTMIARAVARGRRNL